MSLRVPLLFALCVPLASCFQTLDTTASSAGPIEVPGERDPDAGIPPLTETPPIEKSLDDPEAVTTVACEKVKDDALAILGNYCAGCHSEGPQSMANFSFVLDTAKLTDPSRLSSATKQRFIVPGDCANSLLYQRIQAGTMPPKAMNFTDPVYPKPKVSEISVIHTWITSCLGGSPPKPPTSGPGPTADAGVRPQPEAGPTPARDAGGGPVTPPPQPTADAAAPASEAAVTPTGDGGAPPRDAAPGGPGAGPCAGICQNPTRIQQRPFNSGNVGANAVCFDTLTMPASLTCANFDFMRSLSINGQRVNCGMPPATNTIAARNGGYCFSAPAGGNPNATFSIQ